MKTASDRGMLTAASPRSVGAGPDSVDPLAQDSGEMIGALWRYRWAVLLPTIVAAVAGFLFYLRTPETYRSTTRLMLESDNPAILDTMTGDLVGGVPSVEIVQSQLYSDRVVGMAFDDPRMQPFRANFRNDVNKFIYDVQDRMMVLEPEVTDPNASSLVFLLHFDSGDGELSKAAVESFSTALQNFFNEKEKSSRGDLIRVISLAMEQLHPKMLELEQRYRDFRRDAPLAWDGGEAVNPHRKRQLDLIQQRSELDEQLRKKQLLLGAVEEMAEKSKDPSVALNVIGQLLGMTIQIPDSKSVSADMRDADAELAQIELDQQLVPLMIERNKFAAEFGPSHPTVRQLDAELSMMKRELQRLVQEQSDRIFELMRKNQQQTTSPVERANEAVKAILFASRAEVKLLTAQITDVDEQIAFEKDGATRLAKYENDNLSMIREVERSRGLMDQLEEKIARVSLTEEQSGTQVIELTAPSKPYLVGPVLLKMLGIGTILGLAIGSALAILLEKNASTFRNPDEISELLGVPVLTHVPFFKGRIKKEKKGEVNPFRSLDPFLAVIHAPASVVAESIRSCRTAIFFETTGSGGKVIQVTSPLPGDGKSTIAGNLACSIAQSGKRVLAIDCDLRRPQLTDNFNLADAMGLTDVLNGDCDPADACHSTPISNLDLMPSGPIPANPAEALTLPEMCELLQMLREQYDYVILDTPPLLVVTDPSITASMTDGVIMALRIRRKSRPNAKESVGILSSVGAKILGVVINNSDESGSSDGYRGYGYYRYGRYTSRYFRRKSNGAAGDSKQEHRSRTTVEIKGRGGIRASQTKRDSIAPESRSTLAQAGEDPVPIIEDHLLEDQTRIHDQDPI